MILLLRRRSPSYSTQRPGAPCQLSSTCCGRPAATATLTHPGNASVARVGWREHERRREHGAARGS
eukprot:scaffold1589_cov361-Prasinococcus_capsulatus_cf.AAC.4